MAEQPTPMTDEQVVTWLNWKIQRSLNRPDADISEHRTKLLQFYTGDFYGDEEEGFSSVVTREVFETIESALPSFVRVFLSGNTVVEVRPSSEQDEDQAKEETDTLNYLLFEEEEGFAATVAWFRDALLYPNGYAKIWWDDTTDVSIEEYTGLTLEQLAMLDNEPKAEILDYEQDEVQLPPQYDPGTNQVIPGPRIPIFHVRARITEEFGKLCYEPVPPEEVLVDNDTKDGNLDESEFVCHYREVSRSDLVKMGYDREVIFGLPSSSKQFRSTEAQSRARYHDEDPHYTSDVREMEKVDFYEATVLLDVDGDGIAERRRLVMAGNNTLLENEETDYQPLESLTWTPTNHTHTGISMGEVSMQSQRTSSVLMRQGLDNLYRQTRPRQIAGEGVNIDQLLAYEPFSVVEGDPAKVRAEEVPFVFPGVLEALNATAEDLESKTGVSKMSTGLDPEVLAKTTASSFLVATDSLSQRLEMTAREWAETGFKRAMKKAHHLLRKNQDTELQFQLKGKWQTINPRRWARRRGFRAAVGLGRGNTREKLAQSATLYQYQKEALASGLTDHKRMYNVFEDVCMAMGKEYADRYFLDPDSPEGKKYAATRRMQAMQQAQNDPAQKLIAVEQSKVQARLQEAMAKLQNDMLQWQTELEAKVRSDVMSQMHDMTKLELEHQVDIEGAGAGPDQVKKRTIQ